MADQNTKTLSNPKQERTGPPQGGIGFFESLEDIYKNSFELVARGQGDFINEGPVSKGFEAREPKAFSSGSIENFQQPDPNKIIEAALVESFQQKKELTLEDMARYGLAGATKQELATEGNYQPNYEGESVESIYNLVFVFLKRIDKAVKEIINSSLNPFEVSSKRTSSKAAVSGTVDLNQNKIFEAGTVLSPITATG